MQYLLGRKESFAPRDITLLLEVLICLPYARNRLNLSEIATEETAFTLSILSRMKINQNIFLSPFYVFFLDVVCKKHTEMFQTVTCVLSKVGSSYHSSNINRPRCFSWTCLQRINKFFKTKPGKRKQNLKGILATSQTYQAFIIRL